MTGEQNAADGEVARGGHGGHGFPVKLRFVERLKRHNVGRIAILYLGISWVVLEPVHVVFHMLGVPEWVNRVVIVLMALGFPVAVLSAWVYEGSPQALRSASPIDPRRWFVKLSTPRLNRAIGAVLALMLAYFLLYHFWLAQHLMEPVSEAAHGEGAEGGGAGEEAGATVALRSIAVLPFVDMSQARDQEYLSDGLADELLNLLAKIPELRVAARTSAFAFKNKSEDIPSVAQKLHVAHVLEGSVRVAGKHVRITAQLIRADSGYNLWAETYDRDLDDIFKLQDEIASAVVRALKVKLLGGALPARAVPKTSESYNLYLQGRFFVGLHNRESLQKAIQYFTQAIQLDPEFEPSWSALSFAYGDPMGGGALFPGEVLAKARSAATEALRLNPKSAQAHVALGLIYMRHDWDWAAADREFTQALAFDPGNATVQVAAGVLDLALGRKPQAERLFRQAISLDPLHASSYGNLGVMYFAIGKLPEAAAAFRKSLELRPGAGYMHNALGLVLLAQHQPEAALGEMRLESDESWRLQGVAIVLHALGRHAESEAALAQLVQGFGDESPYLIASVHAYRGESDQAFDWLDRALKAHDATLSAIKVDPLLRGLAGDPRYAALLDKIGLAGAPADARVSGGAGSAGARRR